MQEELFQRFIDYLRAEKNASPYTLRNYRTALLGSKNITGFLPFIAAKNISLQKVDRPLIRSYLAYLAEKRLAKASIARIVSVIRSLFTFLVFEGVLPVNPAKLVSSPKLDRRLPAFLTADEIAMLLAAPDTATPAGQRDSAFLELLYASGLRVSELAGLNLDQIDMDTRELRVIGKGSKERVVLIGEPAARALTVYLEQGRRSLLEAWYESGKKPTAVFLAPYEKSGNMKPRYQGRLTERSVQERLEGYAAKISLGKKVHPHMMRHTFATHMLDGGADLRVVQELLGHASLQTTQIYTHVSKSQARKVYLSAHPLAKELASDK